MKTPLLRFAPLVLKSPGIAHATKSRFHFAISGREVLLDDVKISSAEPARKPAAN